jgi:hypothetical protein
MNSAEWRSTVLIRNNFTATDVQPATELQLTKKRQQSRLPPFRPGAILLNTSTFEHPYPLSESNLAPLYEIVEETVAVEGDPVSRDTRCDD